MKPSIRVAASLVPLPLVAAVGYFIFAAVRLLVAGPPQRTIVFPSDFIGTAYVVEDTQRGIDVPIRGLWHREATVQIPPSGILVVRDPDFMHWLTREKVMLADGTVLDGTHPWTHRPSRFRHTESAYWSGIPETHPLAPQRAPDGSIRYTAMELAAEPKFDHLKQITAQRTP
jgi:hypothetical protein